MNRDPAEARPEEEEGQAQVSGHSFGSKSPREVILDYYEEYGYEHQKVATLAALDALEAENQRLRDALERISQTRPVSTLESVGGYAGRVTAIARRVLGSK